jgi:N-acetylmuramoyl-L-alanine amidase
VETYFLNFTTSPEAMRVAARENALSQESVHQLQDLLKKISLNDKIEESRELAADVDHSLVHQLRLGHVTTHDRGVKKAPFVVLIGAHMPSILAEISFLSNPTDERLLKKARYRQRIAQGLFNGIQRYLASLNSLSYNAPEKKPAASPR